MADVWVWWNSVCVKSNCARTITTPLPHRTPNPLHFLFLFRSQKPYFSSSSQIQWPVQRNRGTSPTVHRPRELSPLESTLMPVPSAPTSLYFIDGGQRLGKYSQSWSILDLHSISSSTGVLMVSFLLNWSTAPVWMTRVCAPVGTGRRISLRLPCAVDLRTRW